MIVIGYQGIGKSTLAGRHNRFIDLESGCFWVDGNRAHDWYKPYCQIAVDLSYQGYIVFVSSHKPVRELLQKLSKEVVVVYPMFELKDAWIEKLEKRYNESGLDKDYKALMNAKDRYDENIRELHESDLWRIGIRHMNYDLEDMLMMMGEHFKVVRERYEANN